MAVLTTAGHTARKSKKMLLFSSLVKVTLRFIPLSSDVAKNYVPSTKKSLKMLIHIPNVIGPPIVRVGKGRLDAFMGWQFCLLYRYCFTVLPPNNSDCIGLCNAASSTGSKFNQSGIRWDATSEWLFPIGLLVTQQLRLQAHLCLKRLDLGDFCHSGCCCQDD